MDKIYHSDQHGHLPEVVKEMLAWLLDRVINLSA
jgi:hypothetical protein